MSAEVQTKSAVLMERASAVIPGGVNSPARAFGAVGGTPVVFDHAQGAYLTDVDGNEYIDYVGSWGPFILGHQHPRVVAAIADQLKRATSFGAPSVGEVEIAEMLCDRIAGLDMIRLVSSGTEATMSAVRLARGYTGRAKIAKYVGCYHGHGDSFLIEAGSGALTLGMPSSPGVTEATAGDTVTIHFNDADSLEALFSTHADDLAAVIIEPIAGNMGVVPSDPVYLQRLRDLCTEHGALLIFDEVMTGFRVAFGGASERYGIVPDLFTYGKIIGGGLPVGAYGGARRLMESVSPVGPVYQAGTLSGNPLAVAAGYTTLQILRAQDPYDDLEAMGAYLASGLQNVADTAGIAATINRVGSMITLFFSEVPVTTFEEAKRCDTKTFARFFHAMLQRGIYLPPSQFEAWFLSTTLTAADLDRTIRAAEEALSEIAAS